MRYLGPLARCGAALAFLTVGVGAVGMATSSSAVPEIGLGAGANALALLVGTALIIRGRRRQ
jgi:hypothetical protein